MTPSFFKIEGGFSPAVAFKSLAREPGALPRFLETRD